jgi:hypothetical protein
MYARVATFEGEPRTLDQGIAASREMIESNLDAPPDGLEGAKSVWMLVDRESGRSLGITLFDSEDDLRRGDEALSRMTPPVPSAAKRTRVDLYEIAYTRELPTSKGRIASRAR